MCGSAVAGALSRLVPLSDISEAQSEGGLCMGRGCSPPPPGSGTHASIGNDSDHERLSNMPAALHSLSSGLEPIGATRD